MSPPDLAIVIVGWAVVALLALAAALGAGVSAAPAFSWVNLALVEVAGVALWVALTIPVLWLARHLAARRNHWPVRLSIQAAAVVAVALVGARIESGLVARTTPVPDLTVVRALLPGLDARMLGGLLVLTLTQAARWSSLSRARELQAAELEARLAETTAQVVERQLQPPYLFHNVGTTA